MRNPRPPCRGADIAGNRQRLEKRYLPLGHELRLRSGSALDEAVGVQDEGVVCGSVGGVVHGFAWGSCEQGNRVSYTAGGRVGQDYPSSTDWHYAASWREYPSGRRGKADRPPELMRGSQGARMRSARRLRAQTKDSAGARTRYALPREDRRWGRLRW